MKQIKGYVFDKSTRRVLHNPIIYWLDEAGDINYKSFGTETEGKFSILIPHPLSHVYVSNRGYAIREIVLPPGDSVSLMVYLERNIRNEGISYEQFFRPNTIRPRQQPHRY